MKRPVCRIAITTSLGVLILLSGLLLGGSGLLMGSVWADPEETPIFKPATALGTVADPGAPALDRGFIVNTVPATKPEGSDIYVNDAPFLRYDALPLLDPDDVMTLKNRLRELDTAGIAQISVLILPDTDRDLSEFAPEIMNRWGIQHAGKKDGLLILVNAQRFHKKLSGNRIFVATGYNLEGTLPDAVIGRLLDTYAVSAFDEGNYSTGITNVTLAIADVLTEGKSLKRVRPKTDGPPVKELIFLVLLLFLLSKMFRGGRGGGGGGFLGGGYYGGFGGGFGGGGFGSGGGGFSGGFGGGDDSSSGGGGAGR
jgi:uncharacterized protein